VTLTSSSLLGKGLDPNLRERITTISASVPVDDGGGSSLLKVLLLGELIVAEKLETILEIGVYRGRLFLPLAGLMATLGRGTMIGIDPYSAAAAAQTEVERASIDLRAWPETVDWEGIHDEVRAAMAHWRVEANSRLLRARSEDVAADFAAWPIDLLHVDGNHDRAQVTRDVELFLPHMKPGGILVMDDIAWPSVQPLFEQLRDEHELLFSLVETGVYLWPEDSPNEFAVLRVGGGS
jgi:Methyltransferase domain